MITGQIKNQIDQIWRTFWEGSGITNPMTVLEQMTYLLFMKMLDDVQIQQESLSQELGLDMAVSDATFEYGSWHNPETDKDVPVETLRWHNFKHYEADKMYRTISRDVFPYIKNLDRGSDSAYSRFMGNAVFLIQSPKALVRIVDGIDALDLNDRDTMGDVYEYILGKMAASGQNGQFRTPRHIIRMMVAVAPRHHMRPGNGFGRFHCRGCKVCEGALQQGADAARARRALPKLDASRIRYRPDHAPDRRDEPHAP